METKINIAEILSVGDLPNETWKDIPGYNGYWSQHLLLFFQKEDLILGYGCCYVSHASWQVAIMVMVSALGNMSLSTPIVLFWTVAISLLEHIR